MKLKRIILIATLAAMTIALVSGSVYAYYALTSQAPSSTANSSTNGYYPYIMGNYNYSDGMAGMMGLAPYTPSPSPNVTTAQSAFSPNAAVGYIAIAAAAIFGATGLVYLIKYPRRQIAPMQHFTNLTNQQPTTSLAEITPNDSAPYNSVSKTLTSEERQVLNVLIAHNGKYLQKYIRNETGLSRLKTHRIVSRLAERDIVTTAKTGNTNEVVLSDWLMQSTNIV